MKSCFVIGVCYWNIDHWEKRHFGKMCSIRDNKMKTPSDRKELCNKSKYVEIYFWNYDHIMHWTCFCLNLLSQSEFLFDQNGWIFCTCICMCVCTMSAHEEIKNFEESYFVSISDRKRIILLCFRCCKSHTKFW